MCTKMKEETNKKVCKQIDQEINTGEKTSRSEWSK